MARPHPQNGTTQERPAAATYLVKHGSFGANRKHSINKSVGIPPGKTRSRVAEPRRTAMAGKDLAGMEPRMDADGREFQGAEMNCLRTAKASGFVILKRVFAFVGNV
jgi:hypothetical protein